MATRDALMPIASPHRSLGHFTRRDKPGDGSSRSGLALLVLVAVVTCARPALATKPCPPPPCELRGGAIDPGKCEVLATWIAVGTISNVVHHREGPPLSKDFAEFTFTVKSWEKGSGSAGQQIRFQVGWCDNGRPLHNETSGAFRFFGPAPPTEPSLPNRYLDFEAVRPPRM